LRPTSPTTESYARGVCSTASSAPRTEKVVEFFLEREAAEAIDEVREDESSLAEELRVEAIELG
jgi:hypothetical protein